jgi:stage II sporulation protein D
MINLDEFIGGVVTREMNDGFPREALRAQAVASRSYALHRLRTRGYANGGQAYNSVSGSLSRAAAFYTSKQVLLYNGAIA